MAASASAVVSAEGNASGAGGTVNVSAVPLAASPAPSALSTTLGSDGAAPVGTPPAMPPPLIDNRRVPASGTSTAASPPQSSFPPCKRPRTDEGRGGGVGNGPAPPTQLPTKSGPFLGQAAPRPSPGGSTPLEAGAGLADAPAPAPVDVVSRLLLHVGSQSSSSTGGGERRREGDAALVLIASFLEPLSLLRCIRVSRLWGAAYDNAGSPFRNNGVWTDLSVGRFGTSKVMRWREENSNDKDDDAENYDGDSSSSADNMLHVYRSMHLARVRPAPCRPLDGGGAFGAGAAVPLLGSTSLRGGRVCAWAAMVERSNGETTRCVLRKPEDEDPSSSGGGGAYTSLPVVEVRILLQNTGCSVPAGFGGGGGNNGHLAVLDHPVTVDSSTRRRGEEMPEITWDGRLARATFRANGSPLEAPTVAAAAGRDHDVLFRLGPTESAVLVVHVHAKGCSTTSKFRRRARSVRVLVRPDGLTTVPLMIKVNG